MNQRNLNLKLEQLQNLIKSLLVIVLIFISILIIYATNDWLKALILCGLAMLFLLSSKLPEWVNIALTLLTLMVVQAF
jgi:type IV secretory pathway VirB2 component (pilin)